MRKSVRGALQGCPSEGLAASPHQHQTLLLCFFVVFFQSASPEVWVVCPVGWEGWAGVGTELVGLYNLSYESTDNISGSDGLIILDTETNGE